MRFDRFFIILFFISQQLCLYSQSHSVYLIGDAGEDKVPGKTLRVLQKHLETDSNSTVIFLGDNAYPKGINTKNLDTFQKAYACKDAARLLTQLTILKKYKGNVFFVPGNHDWKAQKKNGAFRSILNEEKVINAYLNDSSSVKNKNWFTYFSPDKKNLPVVVDINLYLSIILFDSQYFFQKLRGRNRKEQLAELDTFLVHLDKMITEKEAIGHKVIIASHHPVFTNGYHSKYRQPLRFLFNWTPFHFLGWLGVNRWLSQDIDQPFYETYREKMNAVLDKHYGLIFAAGHDHNLQDLNVSDDVHLISGAGSKLKNLRKRLRFPYYFMDEIKEGFIKLEFESVFAMKIKYISEDDVVMGER